LHGQKWAKLLAQPKLIALSGRPATFLSGGQQQCVTGVSLVERDGAYVPEFQTATVPFGVEFECLPVALPDGRSFDLTCRCKLSKLGTAPAEYRVTVASSDGPARTEALQQPVMDVQEVKWADRLSAGQAVLAYVGKSAHDHGHLYVAIVPRAITPVVPAAVEAPAALPMPAEGPKLTKLLAKYRQACAAGDGAKARRLAARCLEIDPTCFGK
jgi:hypothetical protein